MVCLQLIIEGNGFYKTFTSVHQKYTDRMLLLARNQAKQCSVGPFADAKTVDVKRGSLTVDSKLRQPFTGGEPFKHMNDKG